MKPIVDVNESIITNTDNNHRVHINSIYAIVVGMTLPNTFKFPTIPKFEIPVRTEADAKAFFVNT